MQMPALQLRRRNEMIKSNFCEGRQWISFVTILMISILGFTSYPFSLLRDASARVGESSAERGKQPFVSFAPLATCSDVWTPTNTSNAPPGQYNHTAVWTGSQMIVWGGLGFTGGVLSYLNTGGRYNPSADAWAAISMTNAPDARYQHTAIWTGSEMIIWGGENRNYLNTGGRYNPSTDSWTPTNATNAPSERIGHTAIWTGSEMIIWGGYDQPPHETNTGGRYTPSTDAWTATTTANAPSGRTNHTAVWTGSQMIVWGGQDINGATNTGGRYCAASTPTSTIQFSQSAYQTPNACASAVITVTRTGDTSQPAAVDYATTDGTATQKSNFTIALGTLSFSAGETSKSFTLLTSRVGFAGTKTATLMLSNPQNAALGAQATAQLQITDTQTQDSPTNPIDDPTTYVCQHYHDFLNREPDQAGLQFWTNQIQSCNGDAQCIDVKRQNVSAAYFLSREFQETGFFVIKIQRAAFGKVSNDATKRLTYLQFLRDAQAVGKGFADLQPGADQILEQNKVAYTQTVAGSQAFIAKYPTTLSAAAYVDAMFATAGVTPQGTERQDAINAFGTGDLAGRAASLRKVAESMSVKNAEFAPAFVLLQYFGYLRRNPTDAPDTSDAGYQFWLSKLNAFGGDYIRSEMVRSFIVSSEYRKRFGSQ
jgi:hypothetical protein